MSPWLIIVTGLIYFWIAVEQFVGKNWAVAIMFAGYAFSNIGLWLLATK